jgi:hypothetical protein
MLIMLWPTNEPDSSPLLPPLLPTIEPLSNERATTGIGIDELLEELLLPLVPLPPAAAWLAAGGLLLMLEELNRGLWNC